MENLLHEQWYFDAFILNDLVVEAARLMRLAAETSIIDFVCAKVR
jgi:hypothetical protein